MTPLHDRIAASFAAQGLMGTLGARIEHVAEGEVQLSMPCTPQVSQQLGFVHAGAITALVDSACGYAALTLAPPDREVVSAEFKINLLRPAVGERLLAVGRVQHAGRTLIVCTGEVRALQGDSVKVVALMQATMATVPGPVRSA